MANRPSKRLIREVLAILDWLSVTGKDILFGVVKITPISEGYPKFGSGAVKPYFSIIQRYLKDVSNLFIGQAL